MRGGAGIAWLLMMLWCCAPPAGGHEHTTAEHRVKAAVLYKLAKFVNWPQPDSADNMEFGICTLGETVVGDALEALQSRRIGNLPIRIHRFSQSRAIDGRCRIVYVATSKAPFLSDFLDTLHARQILTVGDVEQFAARGGIVQFIRRHNRLGFKINLDSASRASLKIAAPLLGLAEIIKSSPGKREFQ